MFFSEGTGTLLLDPRLTEKQVPNLEATQDLTGRVPVEATSVLGWTGESGPSIAQGSTPCQQRAWVLATVQKAWEQLGNSVPFHFPGNLGRMAQSRCQRGRGRGSAQGRWAGHLHGQACLVQIHELGQEGVPGN